MPLIFIPATTPDQIEQISELAGVIWREYWPSHIGAAQTEYMIGKFLTVEAITRNIHEDGYEFWFVLADAGQETEHIVGFTSGHVESETNRFFISKIYLYEHERGKHYASMIIDFYANLARERDLRALYLTVNKYNELGIRAYLGNGFATIDAVETDIGEGFIMDDFIMEKPV